jgi:hypothetical protein
MAEYCGDIFMSNQQPQLLPKPKRVTIEIPKELSAVYANVAFISHTPAEMVIDFAQVLPRMPKGAVMARVIMSPVHAKMLHRALGKNIEKYEELFGEIRTPTHSTLADQLFRFPQSDNPSEDDNQKE